MKNSKVIVVPFVLLLLIAPLFGAKNHISVPITNRVYSILRIGEIRGIINSALEVRPYTTNKVLEYLELMKNADNVSKSEKEIIDDLVKEFTTVQPDNSFKSLATYGSYHTYSENLDIDATMGLRGRNVYGQLLNDFSHFDSRNVLQAYIRGDVKEIASFNMNLGLTFDHLDYKLFLKNDFRVPVKGKYEKFWDIYEGGHSFFVGFLAEPELSISLLNDNLNIRWASIQRDWGVGENNLMLSKDALSINGLELNLQVTPWLRYAFFAGALGKFIPQNRDILGSASVEEKEFYESYLPYEPLHQDKYNNNYTAHRVEVSLPFSIKFGIYESVVYRRRFELPYLNPLSILMFEQDIMGDFDNVLAGIDLQYTLKNYFRTYFSFATTEMNEINPSKFLKAPRNVFSLQAGADVDLPFITFSSATFQYTYIGPFFYTHYPMGSIKEVARNDEEVVGYIHMINAGRNIGYPLRPNSDEFLVKLNMNFKNNWDGSFTFKYQRRSGQYGFDYDKWMRYSAAKDGYYAEKNFKDYLFEKTIGLEVTVNKKLDELPIKFSATYLMAINNDRGRPKPVECYNQSGGCSDENYIEFPVTKYEITENWRGWSINNSLRFSVDIWY